MNLSIESIIMMVSGFFLCFAGWWLFRFSTLFAGFILGASAGYILAPVLLQSIPDLLPSTWKPWVIMSSAVIFGLAGILLLKSMVMMILFIAGFLFGMILMPHYFNGQEGITQAMDIELLFENISVWSVVSGLSWGILFVLLERWLLILLTCSVGAYLVRSTMNFPITVFYGLIVTGTVIQIWMSKASNHTTVRMDGGKT